MIKFEGLEKRREEIIMKIKEIRTMRRGTINEQYLKVPRREKATLKKTPVG